MPRLRAVHGALELEEMDVDAVIRRAPELALIDELAHTNAPGSRTEKRFEDIEDVLAAGIDVISTVNIQHLESLNDSIFELTGVRVRETFPDRILDEADEVVLVDLSPESLQDRLRRARSTRRSAPKSALQNFFKLDNLGALRELRLRELAEDVEARRRPALLDPLSQQAVAERVLALVEPQPKSQRILRRAWRSAQRLGAEIDALWVRQARDGSRRRRSRRSSPRFGASPRCSACTSSRWRATTWSRRCAVSRTTAARPTSSWAPPTSGGASRSCVARCSRGWCASFPASTSAWSRTGRCGEPRCRRVMSVVGRSRDGAGAPRATSSVWRLVPFTRGRLDPDLLAAAIRIARAEDADPGSRLPRRHRVRVRARARRCSQQVEWRCRCSRPSSTRP